MSTQNVLNDLTTKSGVLGNKTVYFGNVNTDKLNGVPIGKIMSEGNDAMSPTGYANLYVEAMSHQKIDSEKENQPHNYEFSQKYKSEEEKGLTYNGNSGNPFFKNSAIGSRAGGVFGNKITVISNATSETSSLTPFTATANVIETNEIVSREPLNKRIKIQDSVYVAEDKHISFQNNIDDKKTVISQGKIITSQIGDENELMSIKANEISMESDVVMGDSNKLVTTHLHAGEEGTLDIKADHIHFTANQITFDPESTEITTGNFPQVIANLGDYESIQKTSFNVFKKPEDRTEVDKIVFSGFWRLQMFYNVIVVKLIFNKLVSELDFNKRMGDAKPEELYLHFPSDYYSHFVDYYGRDDEDYYITETEIMFIHTSKKDKLRKKVGLYFNPKANNFLKLRLYGTNGKQEKWMNDFMGYDRIEIGNVNFGLAVSTPRLKKQYVSTTPSNFMKKPDFFETVTPRKKVRVPKTKTSDIYRENVEQIINVNEELPSLYQLQATVRATKIHRIAFFDICLTFININNNQPVSYNEVLKVMKSFEYNATKFLITFIPAGENRRFACSDDNNSNHVARHPISGVKFIYNPKSPVGLTKGVIDFSEAKPVPCDDDVSMSIQFYHITEN